MGEQPIGIRFADVPDASMIFRALRARLRARVLPAQKLIRNLVRQHDVYGSKFVTSEKVWRILRSSAFDPPSELMRRCTPKASNAGTLNVRSVLAAKAHSKSKASAKRASLPPLRCLAQRGGE